MLALATAGGAWASDLPRAQPADMGFSAERLDFIDRFYISKVEKGELAGIVTLVARHGRIAHFSAVGYADVEKKQKMRTDTIFRLYSMTKPVAATALMMLYEEGRFQLRDPLSKYIPEFTNLRVLRDPGGSLEDTVPPKRTPTIHDALIHSTGFTHGGAADAYDALYTDADLFGLDVTLAQMMSRLAKIPLRYQPGTRWAYSIGPDIQARLVEILSGMPFDEFLQKRLFTPLGMKDAAFRVSPDNSWRFAAVHWVKDGKLVPIDAVHGHPAGRGVVEGWSSINEYTVEHKHKGGSYGLASTAEDYWRFGQMLLNEGEFDGARILSSRVVRYMARDHVRALGIQIPETGAAGMGFGLGFAVVEDPAAAGLMNSEGSFFWSGAAGTHFWIDPREDLVVVAMSQHMGVPAAEALGSELRTLVYSALMK